MEITNNQNTTYSPIIEKQIELYKEYGITDYTIVDDKITIHSTVNLYDFKTIDVDTFKNVTINGNLYLNSLTTADVGLFNGLNLNGSLDLNSLTKAEVGSFNGVNLNGYLYLDSLPSKLRAEIRNNIPKLTKGYNKERGYCFFDGILRKVISVKQLGEYTIYLTPFEYVVQKGEYTAHAKTIEKGIEDISFKILAKEYKENLTLDTILNKDLYRAITGACELGTNNWIKQNNIQVEEISVRELIPLLEKTNAYGLNKIKNLVK